MLIWRLDSPSSDIVFESCYCLNDIVLDVFLPSAYWLICSCRLLKSWMRSDHLIVLEIFDNSPSSNTPLCVWVCVCVSLCVYFSLRVYLYESVCLWVCLCLITWRCVYEVVCESVCLCDDECIWWRCVFVCMRVGVSYVWVSIRGCECLCLVWWGCVLKGVCISVCLFVCLSRSWTKITSNLSYCRKLWFFSFRYSYFLFRWDHFLFRSIYNDILFFYFPFWKGGGPLVSWR